MIIFKRSYTSQVFEPFKNVTGTTTKSGLTRGSGSRGGGARLKNAIQVTKAAVAESASIKAATKANRSNSSAYAPSTPPTGIALTRLLEPKFPLSYSESFEQWSKRNELQQAQDGVMSFLPFYPTSDGIRTAQSLKIVVNDKGDYINEFEIINPGEHPGEQKHLVLLHGYGAGIGFFYKNLDAISKMKGWTIHALDMLGYGLSSRPDFKLNTAKNDPVDGVLQAEKFFTESLESWRKAKGISNFRLVAHSLGAYIGTAYACTFRDVVEKFMLVSPAGVPRNEYSIPWEKVKVDGLTPMELSEKKHKIPVWFKFLWERHVSPFVLVRKTGPLGPKFTSGWTSRRFANLSNDEADALHKYTYAIFNAKGSGEYALNYLLAPGGHGRWPLSERAHDLPCETLWVYGDRDWMDVRGGIKACESIKIKNGPKAEYTVVSNAGHHIYLDNPTEFNSAVLKFMS